MLTVSTTAVCTAMALNLLSESLILNLLRLNVVLPSPSTTVTVVIDGYTHSSTLTSGDSVALGTQTILVCQVVGLPYGTPLSYTWTCLDGDCVPKVSDGSNTYNYGRKIYDSILASIQLTPFIVGHTPVG